MFPLATSVAWVFVARFIDRIGKGIRGAPRDALIADITPSDLRGAAYGLRQALDSAGALVGPLLAIILMARFANDIHAVLWAAVLPAVLAVTLLAVAVREPPRTRDAHTEHVSVTVAELTQLPRRFWGIVSLGAVFTLARFSEAFLLLRAQDVGLAIMYVPAVMVVMNATYAGMAYPAGLAADRLSPRTVLAAGLASLVVADVMLAAAATPVHVFAGAACWGLHMALTQGLFSKLVADEATVRLRGTAFGLYHLVTGVALLVASLVAGALWSTVGPSATFLAGGVFAGIALLGLTRLQPATA
jgi:MFS family permease